MTKEEAIKAMQDGKKVTHRYFSSNEWMSMHDWLIVLEDGVMCTPYEFWRWRTDPVWNNGYDLFNS